MDKPSNTSEFERRLAIALAELTRAARIEFGKTSRGFYGKIGLTLHIENDTLKRIEATHSEMHKVSG